MTQKKVYSAFGIVILAIVGISSMYIHSHNRDDERTQKIEPVVTTENTPPVLGTVKPQPPRVSVIPDTRPTIAFSVEGTMYQMPIVVGETLEQAMERFQNENHSFSFHGKKIPGMGFFVTEMNGVKEGDGKYWVYYIHNVSATRGISTQEIKVGDVIRWERRTPNDY